MFVFSSILLNEVVSLIVTQVIVWVLSSVSTFTVSLQESLFGSLCITWRYINKI